MIRFVIAWRDVNNATRALCVGNSVQEPVAVELVPAAQEEAEDRPYRAIRFDTYDDAFTATEPLAGLLAGLEAAVVAEDELEPQFAADRPSPRPMLVTGPNPLEEIIAERDRELARLVAELEIERNQSAVQRREMTEILAGLALGKLVQDKLAQAEGEAADGAAETA